MPLIADDNFLSELQFWNGVLVTKPLLPIDSVSASIPECVLEIDASNFAWSGVLRSCSYEGALVAKGCFEAHEASESSTFREMLAVCYSARSFVSLISANLLRYGAVQRSCAVNCSQREHGEAIK